MLQFFCDSTVPLAEGGPAGSSDQTYKRCNSAVANETTVNIDIASAFFIYVCLKYYVCQGLVDVMPAGGSAAVPTTESQGQASNPRYW